MDIECHRYKKELIVFGVNYNRRSVVIYCIVRVEN